MGITARGAWESVKFHFRTRGVDVDAEDFTVVGIGDMSGDVFGNGMLLSRHIKLVAAFDHRHVFLDPDPDPAVSFAERQRLFELPRSSWADYNPALISDGGGIWPRSAKSIQLSPQVRAMLGIGDAALALPRSSWADYNPALISSGGGVWPRAAKSVPVSPQARTVLGLDATVKSSVSGFIPSAAKWTFTDSQAPRAVMPIFLWS